MKFLHEFVLACLLICLFAIAGELMPRFVDWRSQLFLSRHLWEAAILAVAMTPIIIAGGIDLSVGSAMGMCAVAFGLCFTATSSLWLSALLCIVTGLAGGMLNGWLIARWRVHPLIITLATYAGFRGIAEGVSQGASYSRFGDTWAQLSRGMLVSIPIPAWIFAALATFTAYVLTKTPLGRSIYTIGHNETAARFSGIDTDRIRFWLYSVSGLLAGVATLVYISRFDTAKADAGTGLELDVITAVVIGGTSILGGKGNMVGTVLGLLLIHETKLFAGRYWRIDELKSILVGGLLIGSLLSQRFFVRESDR